MSTLKSSAEDLTLNADGSGSTTSEVLDDYEEGTWTASLTGTTESIGQATGKYTKIGNVVSFSWYSSTLTLSSSAGTAKINGLPFTSKSGNDYQLFYYQHGNAVDGDTRGGYIATNSTQMLFIDKGGVNGASYIDGSTKYIMVSGFYYVS